MTETVEARRERWMKAGGVPTYLPPSLYAAAEKQGYDMAFYAVNKPIPLGKRADDGWLWK